MNGNKVELGTVTPGGKVNVPQQPPHKETGVHSS